jgi:cytosine deaminase
MEAGHRPGRKALSEGDIPIGSALARNGTLLAVGHNKRVQNADPVTHAEIDCLRNAGRIGSFRDTVLYSTLMPCYPAAARSCGSVFEVS